MKFFALLVVMVCLTACNSAVDTQPPSQSQMEPPVSPESAVESSAASIEEPEIVIEQNTGSEEEPPQSEEENEDDYSPPQLESVEQPIIPQEDSPPAKPPVSGQVQEEKMISFVDHPIYGHIGMTASEHGYLMDDLGRRIGCVSDLQDLIYPDIYGGMYYHNQTLYIFSLDDKAIKEIVDKELTEANIQYELIKTKYSHNELHSVYNHLEENKKKFDLSNVFFEAHFNCIKVFTNEVNDELQKYLDKHSCVVVEIGELRPPPEN